MAAKKKAKKKQTKSEPATRRKLAAIKKTGKKKPPAGKGRVPKKQSASKSAHRKATVKAVSKKSTRAHSRPVRSRSQAGAADPFSAQEAATRSAGQSGDLQGLSDVEGADSESVDELVEEGNAFEAGIVAGVEDAESTPREVHTHEVMEDDVPEEYLDPD